jgi:molybdopterin/thiamine biosynthesis adenylyltransferase
VNQPLHHTLLGCGYQYSPARKMLKGTLLYSRNACKGYYVKDYSTEAGIFKVALILCDDPHIQLPVAYLLQFPDDLHGRLIPHITHESVLCYVAQMEADWDPNDLVRTYRDVDVQIQLTLNNSVRSVKCGDPNDIELEGELSTYWKPQNFLYLLTKPSKKLSISSWLAESTLSNGQLRKEYVSIATSDHESSNELTSWLIQRRFNAESLKRQAIITHYISIKPTRLAGVVWPPSNLKEMLGWLADVDPNARARIVDKVLSFDNKRHILLLDIERQDTLGIYIELNPIIIGLKRHKKHKVKKASMQHLATVLGGNQACNNFKRLGVIKADHDTLLSRNLPRPNIGDLSCKRIALIGCGTIGGYLATLLLRSGAGCGDGYLHLYDNDLLSPHNFGRHTLNGHDFGRNKAKALEENLMNSVHITKNIIGIDSQFPITAAFLSNYDIVIDATGRPPVSKRLASIIRTIQDKKVPILIHSFNDGNGRASKVLVDDGSCCYGCMLKDPATYRNGTDLRFEDIDQISEQNISCGSTYTPYDAAVSNITAALTQVAVLNTLESVIPWTFNEHMLDGSRSRKPRFLKRQLNCPICHEQ